MSERLNYHHLLYFWMVAREGSIVRACAKLRLAQPTVSAQLRTLEKQLGEKLFERRGNALILTEMGHAVHRYADDIFMLGGELMEFVKHRPTGKPQVLRVGISEVIPKLIAFKLLEPAVEMRATVKLHIEQASTDALLVRLALHQIDLLLTDAPVTPQARVRVFNHALGESPITFFATPRVAREAAPAFPRSLDGMQLLLPGQSSTTRRAVESWLEGENLRPVIVAEVDDSALMKVLGQSGVGAFFAPSVIKDTVERQYDVKAFGRVDAVKERFYAVTVERKIKHPAVVAICDNARSGIFG